MIQKPEDYYKNLATPAETVNSITILSRQFQGLGFRYYWATHKLRSVDLNYRPTDESRSTFEIMEHIYGLCFTVVNTLEGHTNIRPVKPLEMDGKQLRLQTLAIIHKAEHTLMAMNASSLETKTIIFSTSKGISTFPFMYLMNGPLLDALTHVGQILSFRRTSGNPQEAGVNVFLGKKNEINSL